MNRDMIKIRWHGRGGQGAITAAKIVAKTTFESGYNGVVMVPSFGTERRGAPVSTSLKISRDKIYDLSPIDDPDTIVVLDHLLLEEQDIISGLNPDGIMVINTPRPKEYYSIDCRCLAIADVTSISKDAGLVHGTVNTGIIGVLAKAVGFLDMELLKKNIQEEFRFKRPRANVDAALLAYENTVIGGA